MTPHVVLALSLFLGIIAGIFWWISSQYFQEHGPVRNAINSVLVGLATFSILMMVVGSFFAK